jgi:tetrathionate reductase subunit B
MCVTTCIGRATYFGDENDPASLIAEVKAANRVTTLRRVSDARPLTDPPPGDRRVEFGPSVTRPRVYYIL